ncbi:MAG: threonylcarbamoyl-AMP synthase [Alphaproteobacteria bacterium]|nr:threonylcarbamoyl-AMP synthase [Alphaproteobacteria bacterium]
MTKIAAPINDVLQEAAALIKAGEVVAFPTETVYGLGADATNAKAVAKIFAAKGRPSFNPLISHGFDQEQLEEEGIFDSRARALADQFWPGPLTMILPKHPRARICDLTRAGLETVALRVPDHAVALKLIETCGVPLAAPSANRSGTLSPTSPHHVAASLADAVPPVPLILAGGACAVGLESTVIDLTGREVVILRAGAISAEDIEQYLDESVTYELTPTEAPRSPGQLLRHYAPGIPMRLQAVDVAADEALLAFGPLKFMGIKGGGHARDLPPHQIRNLSEGGDLLEAAANFFAYLRDLDQPEFSKIAVMDIPAIGIGIAINERLSRAAKAGE